MAKNYVFKKATDAQLNPWLLDQTEPSSPVPAEQFADFVSGNNAKQNNDAATQQYLDSLSKANAADGQPPIPPKAPAPAAPAVIPSPTPTPAPSPEALLAAIKPPARGEPSIALNAKGETVAPDKPGIALSMAPAEADQTLTDPRSSPYSKNQEISRDTQRAEHKTAQNMYQPPEFAAQLLRTVQGYRTPQAQNDDGSLKYAQEVVPGPDGRPMLVDGKPVTRNGAPVYDSSKETLDPTAPYQQALGGIDKQKSMLADLAQYTPVQRDLSPLMTFAGILSKHPELAKNYNPGSPYTDTLEKIIQGQKGVTDQQNKLFSDSTAAAKAMKDGTTTDLASQILMNQALAESGTKPSHFQDQADLKDMQNAFRAHQSTMAQLDKDKTGTGMLSTYQTLGNALGIINHTGKVTPQQVSEFQGLLRQAIGAGPAGMYQSTGSEREAAVAKTADWSLANLKQFINGDPAAIDPDGPLMKHLQDVAGTEQQNVRHLYNSRLNAITQGHSYLYDENDPDYNEEKYGRYRRSLDSKLAAMRGQLDPIGATPGGNTAEITRQIDRPASAAGARNRTNNAAEAAAKAAPKADPYADMMNMSDEEFNAELAKRGIK